MKFKAYVKTTNHGSRVEDILEIPDEELEGKSESEREQYIEETIKDFILSDMEWGYEVIE